MFRGLRRMDPLGAFVDQSYWEMEVRRYVEEMRDGDKISLLQIDFDHFGAVNKTLGHPVGDNLIREYGKTVNDVLAGNGDAFRRGGDEAIVVLPGKEQMQAGVLAEQIRKSIESAFSFRSEMSPAPTASIGVLEIRRDMTFSQAVAILDETRRRAKELGRNRVAIHV